MPFQDKCDLCMCTAYWMVLAVQRRMSNGPIHSAHRSTTASMLSILCPNLGIEHALFLQLGLATTALSGDALPSGLLLFRHICDGRDHGFEQRLQLRFLTEALNQFDPGSHRSFAGVFEGVERAARHAHALRHVGLGDFFLNPQGFQALRQNQRNLIRRRKIKV